MKAKIPQPPDALHASLADAEAFLAWARGDLDRLITKLALPYVDDSNPILHLDELRAEFWAKVARILHSGRLASCATRQKTFGYLKASLRNHLFSLIQKHVFSSKRNGWTRVSGRAKGSNGGAQSWHEEPLRVSLDDPEAHLQLGAVDNGRELKELLDNLESNLLPAERLVLDHLINGASVAATSVDREAPSLGNGQAGAQQRWDTAIGLSGSEFERIRRRLKAKARQCLV